MATKLRVDEKRALAMAYAEDHLVDRMTATAEEAVAALAAEADTTPKDRTGKFTDGIKEWITEYRNVNAGHLQMRHFGIEWRRAQKAENTIDERRASAIHYASTMVDRMTASAEDALAALDGMVDVDGNLTVSQTITDEDGNEHHASDVNRWSAQRNPNGVTEPLQERYFGSEWRREQPKATRTANRGTSRIEAVEEMIRRVAAKLEVDVTDIS